MKTELNNQFSTTRGRIMEPRAARPRFSIGALAAVLLCMLNVPGSAKEITSNGLGGGRWSDGATWRGGAVPTAEDEAVIGARDTVLFDRDDVDTPTCKQ